MALSTIAMSPAAADVWVAGNGKTLHVLVYGNSPDSAEAMGNRAFSLSQEGWHQLWQGDDSDKGWIAVSCVRRADNGVHFEFATAQPDEAAASRLARAAADNYIAKSGGTLIAGCGGAANHDGRLLTTTFDPPK